MVTESGCWIFIGSLGVMGYAQIFTGSRTDGTRRILRGHKVMYEAHRGVVPPGLVLDHLCRVHECVNPWHLEPVTNRVNILRGIGPTAQNAAQGACRKCGGPYSARTDGGRRCRPCHVAYHRAQRRLAKVAA